MSTIRTKPGRKAGIYQPRSKGAVFATGKPPRGTTPKRAGSKLSRRVDRLHNKQHHVRGGGL